jgi:hypothetical protein
MPGTGPQAGGPGSGGEGPGAEVVEGRHPVRVLIEYPEEGMRLQALFFSLLGFVGALIMIPHVLWLFILGIGMYFVHLIAFFAVLILGRYPRGMWEFMRGVQQYALRLQGYMRVLSKGYPPFGPKDPNYGLELHVPYPEKTSRLWLFFAGLASIPVVIVHYFYAIAEGFVTFLGVWAVLFTGHYPRSWFEFVRKVWQHRMRIACFVLWLRNEYPPFGLKD